MTPSAYRDAARIPRRLFIVNHGPDQLVVGHGVIRDGNGTLDRIKTTIAAQAHLVLEPRQFPVDIGAADARVLVVNTGMVPVEIVHRGPDAIALETVENPDARDWSYKPPTTTRGKILRWRRITAVPARSEAVFVSDNLPMKIA
jgi:hypothetical protein